MKRRSQTLERGAVLVETAVILVPMFFFIFAIFEIGRFMLFRNLLQHSVREGARLAVVNTDMSGTDANQTADQVKAYVKKAMGGQSLTDLSVTIFQANGDGTFANANWEKSASYQKPIVVEVAGKYLPIIPSFGLIPKTGAALKYKAIMLSEGH